MLFNSIEFLLFLPLAFFAYWLVGNRKWQNLVIVVSSAVFYGWWDWRFLGLISFTSCWSYIVGRLEERRFDATHGSKLLLVISCVVNLGILAYFKYFNFFIDSFVVLLRAIGIQSNLSSLNVILPVGISFYTFQALSYTIDVYRRQIRPTRDFIAFLAFISFFPQLVAGPIERATNLLPQFSSQRTFSYPLAVAGCRQMLCGFFKKVLVADTCAKIVNALLANNAPSSVSLWIGMLAFTFQIYGDFSGYSDIAIGCAKLFGVNLMRNFSYPYFARDIADFWRRWHISLTTWFRDYLYIPLGGSRCATWRRIRNTMAIFLVSGFWHGANWTFVFWGLFHAICFIPLLLRGKNRRHVYHVDTTVRVLPKFCEVRDILLTFLIVVIGWTFFRAPDLVTAFRWVGRMVVPIDLRIHQLSLGLAMCGILPVLTLVIWEWYSRNQDKMWFPRIKSLRWFSYLCVALSIVYFKPEPQSFIYFQF